MSIVENETPANLRESEILYLEEKLVGCLSGKHDLALLEALVADGYKCLTMDGAVFTKSMYLDGIKKNLTTRQFEIENAEVVFHGDVAVVTSTAVIDISYHGLTRRGSIRSIRTWKQFGRDWKVVSSASIPASAGDVWAALLKQR